MSKTILITGTNGVLGNRLTYFLSHTSNHNVIATSKGENRLLKKSGYSYIEMDITDPKQVEKVFHQTRPDVVIHSAAITQVDQCEVDKELCDKVNVQGTKNIVEVCEKYNSKLVYISTDFVFDGEADKYTEESKLNPISYYGRSKQLAEQAVIQGQISSAIVRTILVYGITENMSRSNIVLWVRKSLMENKTIHVVSDQYRMPTLVDDLVDGITKIVDRDKTGVYHLSGAQFLSVYDIAIKVAKFYNLDASLIHPILSAELNQKGKRPRKTQFDLIKSNNELDYYPRTFEEGLIVFEDQRQKIN